jgi:hypothetical protein
MYRGVDKSLAGQEGNKLTFASHWLAKVRATG